MHNASSTDHCPWSSHTGFSSQLHWMLYKLLFRAVDPTLYSVWCQTFVAHGEDTFNFDHSNQRTAVHRNLAFIVVLFGVGLLFCWHENRSSVHTQKICTVCVNEFWVRVVSGSWWERCLTVTAWHYNVGRCECETSGGSQRQEKDRSWGKPCFLDGSLTVPGHRLCSEKHTEEEKVGG